MRKTTSLANQLEDICRLTGVAWAAWLAHEDSAWGVTVSNGLSPNLEAQCMESLKSPAIQAQISDAFVISGSLWRSLRDFSNGAPEFHVYVFPNANDNLVLMLGFVDGIDPRERLSQISTVSSMLPQLLGVEPVVGVTPQHSTDELIVGGQSSERIGQPSVSEGVRQMEDWVTRTGEVARVLLFVEKDGRTCCVGRAGELPVGNLDDENVVTIPMDGIAPWKGRLVVVFSEPGASPSPDWLDAARVKAESLRPVVMEGLLRQALECETEARQMLENRLEHATRLISLGELAAGVSHEMVSPLSTISGFLRMALEDIDPNSPVYGDLTLSLQESDRLRDLVGRMLDLARVPDRILRSVDVNDLTRDVVALTFPSMRMAGVKVDTEFQSNLAPIQAEPASLKQVMINLIQNAIQAMPGGGNIRIRTAEGERCDQKGIVWQIVDNGPGIQPESLSKIFEPFFTTKPRGTGTGLGLAIVKSIVQTCGGEIEVATTLNHGTAFTIWLPMAKDAGGQIV